MTGWNVVLGLHLLAMAFFVGGQLMLAGIVVPVLRGREDGVPLRAAARRFGYGTLIAVGVLIATGAAMATHEHKWGNGTLHIKLGLVGFLAIVILVHMKRPTWHVLDALVFLTSLAIVWCGIVIAG